MKRKGMILPGAQYQKKRINKKENNMTATRYGGRAGFLQINVHRQSQGHLRGGQREEGKGNPVAIARMPKESK